MTLAAGYTTLKTNRFERKFVIERGGVSYVERIVKLNSGAFRPVFYERQINNIYFDTHNLRNYYDNHFGKSKRVKVRIRWYGDTYGLVKTPILEFKLKSGPTGRKLSFKLNEFTYEDSLKKSDIIGVIQNSDVPEWVLNELKYLVPTLVNTYKRKYYLSFNRKFRFTIDHHMDYYRFTAGNLANREHEECHQTVVLELKYDMEHDTNAGSITSELPFRLGKFSKYVTGIEIFNDHLAV